MRNLQNHNPEFSSIRGHGRLPVARLQSDSTRRRVFTLWAPLLLMILIGLTACKEEVQISGEDREFEENLKTQLIEAQEGTVIRLPAGTFQLTGSLSLKQNGVTIRGAGIDQTILNFSRQTVGSEGLTVNANDFTIEDLAIEDTKGDALKVNGGKNITIRRVRTEWTNGPDEDNGAYGIYPVQCENVLIEESVAIGASDAGIYVGQSTQIIVRNNRAEYNVAGIEIENSTFADVYNNVATKNTGGILVFDLPDLPVQGGQNTRVFKNEVIDNNTDNFAPSGNIVGRVPTGTGMMILANDNIEIFENIIQNHKSVSIAVVSYYLTEEEIKDEDYDPIPEGIYIHDNKIENSGFDPTGGSSFQSKKIITALSLKIGTPFPAILYDGVVDESKLVDGKLPDELRICVENNGDAEFIDLDAANDFSNTIRNPEANRCAHARLQPVSL
ncbi:MAG: right-handed parallel beta-helix repeat-containing protein [Leptospiraceae bacterium]|nr:right-handed parallel beta-helix repeat-containing protein [Leptospiraceae bacterium]